MNASIQVEYATEGNFCEIRRLKAMHVRSSVRTTPRRPNTSSSGHDMVRMDSSDIMMMSATMFLT